ncbi:MAG: BMP family protein [Longimicrobiales bacterium]|nr:BMP family protein [Longimicrobiales bacterium]
MARTPGAPSVLVGLVTALVLATCGPANDTTGAAAAPFRAALLTAGPVSDAGWYAGAWEGLLAIEAKWGAAISHQQTRTPSEYDEAFLAYGTEGYDLVFAHGSEYQDAAIRAGERFPGTTFIVSGGGRIADNVVPLIFTLENGSYLAGMAAGGMTESGIVGMIGGVRIPPAEGVFLAFEAGVKAVRPDARIVETWIGSWDDVAAAKEAATSQIARGADVLVHNTDGASFGFFNAVREAVAEGSTVWAIGMNRNQNDVAPEVTLGSAVIRIEDAFLEITDAWRRGELGGAAWYAGAEDEVVDFVANPAVLDRIPASLLARIDSMRTEIRTGAFAPPRVPFIEGEEAAGGVTSAGGAVGIP